MGAKRVWSTTGDVALTGTKASSGIPASSSSGLKEPVASLT